ncbi:30S ribosomal protein S3, partial [Candidatus Micrarchaeota archaeon CG10_big_fil_rev_8_21_14_0_10_59_7]
MAIEKKFIKKALNDLQISGFLGKELERAGVSTIEVQKTPIATRITITVRRPGLVVGKRGKTIKDLCDELTRRFGMENPQIEVVEVANPSLDAKLMAERVGKRIEMRPHAKAAMRISLREIMEAGAIGAEIRVAGKIVGKGGKAKAFKVKAGYIKKSGDMMKSVNVGTYIARLKAGCVGV